MIKGSFFNGSSTTRKLILGFVFLIGLYVGYFFHIAAINQESAGLQQQENDLKQQLALVIKKSTAVKYDLQQLPVLKIKLAKWKQSFIPFSKLTELLNDILKAGANKQLYFAAFDPDEAKPAGLYSLIPIKVIVVGNYHQIAGFLSQVANMPSIVQIDHFTISNTNTDEKLGTKLATTATAQGLLTADLALNVYYVPTKPNPPIVPTSPASETKK